MGSSLRTQALRDEVLQEDISLDTAAGVLSGVKLVGLYSKHGRAYSPKALKAAIGLYEGAPVNLDHIRNDTGERSVRDAFGVIRNVRFVEGRGLYGDLVYIKSHDFAPVFEDVARLMPNQLGLSHHAFGKVGVSETGDRVVEQIERVISVDVVRVPATTKGLFESEGNTVKTAKTLLESLQDADSARLLAVLQEDDMMGYGDAVMPETEAEPSAQDALDALVLAVLHDDTIDAQEKLARIRKILGVADALPADDKQVEAPAQESANGYEDLLKLVSSLHNDMRLLMLCESAGIRLADLSDAQRALLRKAPNEETVTVIAESLRPGRMPIGFAHDGETYDSLKTLVFGRKG